MLKSIFGDSKIGLKWIVSRANELHNKLKITLKNAFLKAWAEVRQMFTYQLYIRLKLFVQGKTIYLTSTLQDAISDSMEFIGEMVQDKRLYYNISKRIYSDYNRFTDMFAIKSSFTFGQNIYITEV